MYFDLLERELETECTPIILGKDAFRVSSPSNVNGIQILSSDDLNAIRKHLRRVDVVEAVFGNWVLMNKGIISLIASNDKTLGIPLVHLIERNGMARIKFLERLQKTVALAKKFGVRTWLYTSAASEHQVRSPHLLAGLGTLIGFSPDQALWNISKVPEYLLGNVK